VLAAHFVLGWLARAAPAPLSGHAGHHHAATLTEGSAGLTSSLGMQAVGWFVMVAVMAPLIAPNVRYVALRSPRQARAGVTVNVVAGWAVVWAGGAIVLGLGVSLMGGVAGNLVAIGLVTVVTVGWQDSSLKRRSLARCHQVHAPPLNRRQSRRTCQRFGVRLGRNCVLSCWPLMTLMAVAGHNPAVVAACGGVAWYERRRRPHHDPGTRETSLAIAAIGATAFVAAVLA
jgi:predicted metal-binding membrane protein